MDRPLIRNFRFTFHFFARAFLLSLSLSLMYIFAPLLVPFLFATNY